MASGDLPESVRLADGRTEPFEPERIARSLFAAGERLGVPDAFLARELTDGVLHFLSTEDGASVATATRIAEVVGKVVRELGHPGLALEYEVGRRAAVAAGPPSAGPEHVGLPEWATGPASPAGLHLDLAHAHLRAFSLTSVFPRDVVSAHEEGLIRLTGLEHPRELDGTVAHLPPGGLPDALAAGRNLAGGYLAVDGPEFDLGPLTGEPAELADSFLRPARFAAGVLGVQVILNLNASTLPPRLAEASGPLFQTARDGLAGRRREIAVALAERAGAAGFGVWWHLSADDPEPVLPAGLVGRGQTEIVLDRPKTPVALGPGVDRQTPAALIRVGLNLARLVEMAGGPPVDAELFLRKVGSLTRFAKTAGHVKQDFLRRHGRSEVRAAFLLDRARLVLTPTGLEVAARATDRAPAEFARDVLRTIRGAAETDRPRVMPVRIAPALDDGVWSELLGPAAPVRHQVRLGGQLHGAAGAGRVDLAHPESRPFTADETAVAIRLAADAGVTRIGFTRP